jgi:S-adenosylmethionine-diacylgycerolhomoserine-N-methlytransferase
MGNLEKYYRIHSRIYDLTRWTFLFGRHELARLIGTFAMPGKILEVGCGTGYNLLTMARLFPHAELTGLDLSADMLHVAEKKLARRGIRARLLQKAYDASLGGAFDLVLFSYSLSMMGNCGESAVEISWRDLEEKGMIAIVDFHDTRSLLCKKWLDIHHVSLESSPRQGLDTYFSPLALSIRKAYGGLWSYYSYIGRKKGLSL